MDNIICDLPTPFVDDRGSLQLLVDYSIGSVVLISSKKGTVRANHYHHDDEHHCYLVSGQIEYYHRPVGSTEDPEMVVIEPGQMFYTPSNLEHAMKFTEDSVFLTFGKRHRTQEDYEADLVRVNLI